MEPPMTDQNLNLDNQITTALLKDRRTDRRWRNIRFFGWMIIFIIFIVLIFAPSKAPMIGGRKPSDPYVSLVRLSGIIMPNTAFSAERVLPQLQNAFEDKDAKGVVLVINSPGGSPVQASIIHDKILQLKTLYHKKVIVVGDDALASGAYLIATAADKIYVHKDTLTGSIGVIMSGFGFVDTLNKLGMTRRLFTAGENKARMDPFEQLKPQDVEKIKHLLDQVHQDFIGYVVQGRGDRLRGDRKELFSGDFWTGSEAVNLGLADGTQNLWEALKSEFDVTHFRNYTTKNTFLQNLVRDADTELNWHLLNNTSPVREQAY
jgi:protease-4